MRKMMFSSIMTTIFLVAAFNVFAQEQTAAPIFKDGDFWQFRVREWDWITRSSDALNGIYELLYSQGKVRIFELGDDQKVELDRRPSSLLVLLGLSTNPGYQDLKFPLFVGQKWSYEYRAKIPGTPRLHSRSVEIHVSGIEEVTTPAGTFRAFKIVKEDWAGPESRWVTTYFYNPET